MKNMSENPIIRGASSFCRSLSDIRFKEDHAITLSLYNATNPEKKKCEHIIKGSSDHGLIKAIAVIGVISVTVTAFCTACSLLKDK